MWLQITPHLILGQRFCPPQGWLPFSISGGMGLGQKKNIWDFAANNLDMDPPKEAIFIQNPCDLDISKLFIYHR